jgi:hypothetical protein
VVGRCAVAALGASVLAALTLGVGSASAGVLGCNYGAGSEPFSQWGDYANYVPVQGGTFEGSTGWTLTGGAAVVGENNPFHLASATDTRSLILPPGSSATTPGVCLGVVTPTLRFVGYSSNGSAVHVALYTRTLFGLVQIPTTGDMNLSTSWGPSEVQYFLLQNVLGLVNLNSANIYFRFTPIGSATVHMDDVFLDPTLWE